MPARARCVYGHEPECASQYQVGPKGFAPRVTLPLGSPIQQSCNDRLSERFLSAKRGLVPAERDSVRRHLKAPEAQQIIKRKAHDKKTPCRFCRQNNQDGEIEIDE
jgi:hypothetical protein